MADNVRVVKVTKTEPSPSMESLTDQKGKRETIEKMILKVMKRLDPAGDNEKRWAEFFKSLDDKKFAAFMEHVRKCECQLNLVMPNMKKTLKVSDLVEAAKMVNLKLAHRLWLYDKVSGRKYLTNEEHLVLMLPIRRAQQEWDKKLSVPSRDKSVDLLTGQVVGDDRNCALAMDEMRSLGSRGLTNTLIELAKVRGGDVAAYGDFKRQMQENGSVKLSSLDPSTRVRSADMAKILFRGMMLDCNL